MPISLPFSPVILYLGLVVSLIGCGPTRISNAPIEEGVPLSTVVATLNSPEISSSVSSPLLQVTPQRIISTAPSITEALFAIGLGSQVIAVSDFCQIPSQVKNLPKVGNLFNPNIERILELRPNLVIVLREHGELAERLYSFHLNVLSVDHSCLAGVLNSFDLIGNLCSLDIQQQATSYRETFSDRLEMIRKKTRSFSPPRVLISIDRQRGGESLSNVYVAGSNPYFQEILEIVHAVNIFADATVAVPIVSREGILERNPDVIIDLSTDGRYTIGPPPASLLEEYIRDWTTLGPTLTAVRDKRIYPFIDAYATIPGPSSLRFIEELAARIHPDW